MAEEPPNPSLLHDNFLRLSTPFVAMRWFQEFQPLSRDLGEDVLAPLSPRVGGASYSGGLFYHSLAWPLFRVPSFSGFLIQLSTRPFFTAFQSSKYSGRSSTIYGTTLSSFVFAPPCPRALTRTVCQSPYNNKGLLPVFLSHLLVYFHYQSLLTAFTL